MKQNTIYNTQEVRVQNKKKLRNKKYSEMSEEELEMSMFGKLIRKDNK